MENQKKHVKSTSQMTQLPQEWSLVFHDLCDKIEISTQLDSFPFPMHTINKTYKPGKLHASVILMRGSLSLFLGLLMY